MEYKLADLCNVDSEKFILGAIMLKPDTAYEVNAELEPTDFSRQVYRIIYAAMLGMIKQDIPLDMVSLVERLKRDGVLAKCGGIMTVSGIANYTPTATGVMEHVKIVADYAKRRKMVQLAEEVRQQAFDMESDISAEDIQSKMSNTILPKTSGKLVMMNDAIVDFASWMDSRAKSEFHGILSGINALDLMTTGFDIGKLVIIAARPSMGKTALAGQIIVNAAQTQKKKILFFSLEMEREEIIARMVSMLSGVDSQRIANPKNLSSDEWTAILFAEQKISEWSLAIDTDKRQTPSQIGAKARIMQAQTGLDLIVVDYIQLMTDGQKHRSDNRVQEIGNISRELKKIAGQFKVPVIALSQLSRGVEARNDKRPMLSDLRDSGSIEQDADMVLMLYRDKYYNPGSDDITELLLKKNRGGRTGEVRTMFVPQLTKFQSIPQDNFESQTVANNNIPY